MEFRRWLHLRLLRQGHLRQSSGGISFMARAAGSRVVVGIVTFVASTSDSPLPHLFARPHGALPCDEPFPFLNDPDTVLE
ncbi:hypothetical protein TIFTF001_020161 [Ficus carica]|uniref:Uncharacterized protein n=1 Tax=Ficus carica TaxID=3494 RepID=A0AA88AD36_FICCA|nr:hypothetical protein TIFTF001_020161 [Ficus carica]